MSKKQIILASASPRRSELLESAGINFLVVPSDIPEAPLPDELPAAHVLRLATEKAFAVAAMVNGEIYIGADTVVVCDDEIMGKPVDAADAKRMLSTLSGRSHQVITGYAVHDRSNARTHADVVSTLVFFKSLSGAEIDAYIATGCPFDKAGAYAIQGGAAYMVQKIEGSYSNVVGLPLCEVVEALRGFGV